MRTLAPVRQESGGEASSSKHASTERLRDATKQFEGILVRQVIESLQKATQQGRGGQATGGALYDSMVTDAFANAVMRAGGLGLSESLVRSLGGGTGTNGPQTGVSGAAAKKSPQASDAPSVPTTERRLSPGLKVASSGSDCILPSVVKTEVPTVPKVGAVGEEGTDELASELLAVGIGRKPAPTSPGGSDESQ